MTTLPPDDQLVQSLALALSPVLTPLLGSLPLVELLKGADKTVRDAVLEAARLVAERALGQPRPANATQKKTCALHTALGPLSFPRWYTLGEDGKEQAPIPHSLWGHGCTAAVREQIAWLHALMTTHETVATMRLFRASQPSLATAHRVAVEEGCELAAQFSPELFGSLLQERVEPLADQVELIVFGADGGHVPMRGEPSAAARQWHEGRVVTLTLLGAADPKHPRTVTLFDGEKREHEVGLERPVLAAIVLGQMPTLEGPRSARVEQGAKTAYAVLKALCPQAAWQGLCDGGDWPEAIVDATVGEALRTNDVCHASDHLLDAARARFPEEKKAKQWWAEERTRLMTEPGEADRLVKELTRSSQHMVRHADKKALETEVGYFRKRAANMAYAERLAGNEMIGSGPTEAAVKQVITVRLKRVGATWGPEGGDAVMHTRSLVISQLWEGAWRERVRQQFAPYQAAA